MVIVLGPWAKLDIPDLYIVACQRGEVGSPTNPPWAPGSDKTQGQGSFGPFTGGLDLLGSLQTV